MVEKKGKILSQGYTTHIKDWLTKNPGNYLEIGSYNGVFISELAENYPNFQLFSIDPFIADGYTGQEIGEELHKQYENFLYNTQPFSNIKLFKSTTLNCLENKIYLDFKDISCILIDGSHLYEDVKIDFEFIQKIERKKDILIVLDDLTILGVKKATEEFLDSLDKENYSIIEQPSIHIKLIVLKP